MSAVNIETNWDDHTCPLNAVDHKYSEPIPIYQSKVALRRLEPWTSIQKVTEVSNLHAGSLRNERLLSDY